MSKHDKLIKQVEHRLKRTHPECLFFSNHEYKLKRKAGEADLLMINPKKQYAYAFEIKTFDRDKSRKKASFQLDKDRGYIRQEFGIKKTYCFYVHGYPKNFDYSIIKSKSI